MFSKHRETVPRQNPDSQNPDQVGDTGVPDSPGPRVTDDVSRVIVHSIRNGRSHGV